MLHAHIAHTDLARATMAAAMIAAGIAAFLWPRCFSGAAGYFTRSPGPLAPADQERLRRVVVAREDAEGLSGAYGRYLGLAAILFAGLEAIRTIPYVVPYALFCLASAGIMLLAYLQFHRATQRRVAPLVRRSPFAALPPAVIAAMACMLAISVALALYPPERFGATVAALSTIVLGLVAWRVAAAPALMIGVDPQWEYAVDERVRIGRARSIALLACAPGFVVVALATASFPAEYATIGTVAMVVASAAFLVSVAASILPRRRRIAIA
ncbi:MAG TPA: hypothetical protein VMU38_00720 [Candidatus Binatia bacterium]|nr:hypothetical protein [Candidatus Binatia bacterium]